MVALLIEEYEGNFPLWLAPLQAVVIPIADRHIEYAEEVAKQLKAAKLRVEVDARGERMNAKIRDAQMKKVPYMLVVGDKEAAAGTVSVRRRGSRDEERGIALDAFVDRIKKERDTKALPADFSPHEPTAGDAIA